MTKAIIMIIGGIFVIAYVITGAAAGNIYRDIFPGGPASRGKRLSLMLLDRAIAQSEDEYVKGRMIRSRKLYIASLILLAIGFIIWAVVLVGPKVMNSSM